MKEIFLTKKINILFIAIIFASIFLLSCINKKESKAEIDYTQLSANIPELDALHESIYILWHNAYPNKDYSLIIRTLPQLDISVSNLVQAELPGILKEKQAEWDQGVENLKSNLDALHKAVEEDNKEAMLNSVESFHSSYEKLVSITRPKLPELESFHQELYKLYHYYMPGNDLEKIRGIIPLMKEKVISLKAAKLPTKYLNRQTEFNLGVTNLESSLAQLENTAKTSNTENIRIAVEKVHTDYQALESIFE